MLKQLTQKVNLYCDSIITVIIHSLFYRDPVYNRRVTNKKTMFDSKLQPLYDGQVLVNEQAKKDAVVLALSLIHI